MRSKVLLFTIIIGIIILLIAGACAAGPTPAQTPAQTAVSTLTPTSVTAKPTTPTSVSSPTGQPIKLKFSTVWPAPPAWTGVRPQMWMDEMTKRTNGQVTFETYWGGSLGTGVEQLSLVRKGTVDVGFVYFNYEPEKFPLSYFQYAFPFGPYDAVLQTKASNQLMTEFPQFIQELNNNNMKLLVSTMAGHYALTSTTPLKTVDDLKGKKTSVVGQWLGEALKGVGAVPISAAVTDRYEMLQRGTVNCDCVPILMTSDYKLYEVVKNFYDVGFSDPVGTTLVMNLDVWNKLPPDMQQLISKVDEDIELQINTIQVQMETDQLKVMQEKGLVVGILPATELEKWMQMSPDIPAMWATQIEGQYKLPAFQIVQRYQEITAQMGYKWARQWGIKK